MKEFKIYVITISYPFLRFSYARIIIDILPISIFENFILIMKYWWYHFSRIPHLISSWSSKKL